jgi:hypothetical protein
VVAAPPAAVAEPPPAVGGSSPVVTARIILETFGGPCGFPFGPRPFG